MTDYAKRLIWIDEERTAKVNPLVWPFFMAMTIYGLGFLFFSPFDWVSTSSLFQSFASLHSWLPRIWGGFALVSGLSAMAMVLYRKMVLGGTAAMSGFLVWFFACTVYVMNGYLLVAVTVSGVNLYFWMYYYFRFRWYNRQKALGKIHDPA